MAAHLNAHAVSAALLLALQLQLTALNAALQHDAESGLLHWVTTISMAHMWNFLEEVQPMHMCHMCIRYAALH